MTKPIVTGWFPHTVKPTRIGVYERSPTGVNQKDDAGWFANWNGEYWSHTYCAAEPASKCTRRGMFQNWYWRGVKKDENE